MRVVKKLPIFRYVPQSATVLRKVAVAKKTNFVNLVKKLKNKVKLK